LSPWALWAKKVGGVRNSEKEKKKTAMYNTL